MQDTPEKRNSFETAHTMAAPGKSEHDDTCSDHHQIIKSYDFRRKVRRLDEAGYPAYAEYIVEIEPMSIPERDIAVFANGCRQNLRAQALTFLQQRP